MQNEPNSMTKTLAKRDSITLTAADIETLIAVGVIPPGTPAQVVEFFRKACAETGLSPFRKQVHLINRGDKYTIQTSIDGYRTIADRTGKYAGSDDYVFDEGLTIYQMLEQKRDKPRTATATVYKVVGGVRCPFTASVRWAEYYPGERLGFMWNRMPFLMPGKCAESLALRKAFPEETSGIFIEEEMIAQSEPLIRRAQIPTTETLNAAPVLAEPQSTTLPEGGETVGGEARESKAASTPLTGPVTDSRGGVQPLKRKRGRPSTKNQTAMVDRLKVGGFKPEDLEKVCRDNDWISDGEGWPFTEERLATFLDDENWPSVQIELESLPKHVLD